MFDAGLAEDVESVGEARMLSLPHGAVGSYDCSEPDAIARNPDWDTDPLVNDAGDDYALIHLASSLGATWGVMTMSTDSQGDMDDWPSISVGYPIVMGGGGSACSTDMDNPSGFARVDTSPAGSWNNASKSTAEVIGWTTQRIQTSHDISKGNSGGPIWFCEDAGGCGGALVEEMSGLVTAFHHTCCGSETGHVTGPKVGEFRAWVLSNM
jgi:hypothetical protein